jgi:hypothetical protein
LGEGLYEHSQLDPVKPPTPALSRGEREKESTHDRDASAIAAVHA